MVREKNLSHVMYELDLYLSRDGYIKGEFVIHEAKFLENVTTFDHLSKKNYYP